VALAATTACAPSTTTIRSTALRDAGARLQLDLTAAVADEESERTLSFLDAAAAARLALRHHPDGARALATLGLSAADIAQALPDNPRLHGSVVAHDDAAVDLAITQNLTSLLSFGYRRSAASAAHRAARQRAVASLLAAALRARVAYFQFVATTQIAALREKSADAAASALKLTEEIHAAGNTSDFELLRAQLAAEENQDAHLVAERDRDSARFTLLAAMGVSSDAKVRPSGDLAAPASTVPSADAVLSLAQARSLELAEARALVDAGAAGRSAARIDSVPALEAGLAATREGGHWGFGPAIGLEIPLFDLGQGGRARATAAHELAELQLRAHAQVLPIRVAAATTRLRQAHDRAVRLRDHVLPRYRTFLDEGVRQYNAMATSPFELLSLRQRQLEAEVRYIQSLGEYWIAQAEVDHLSHGGAMSALSAATPSAAASVGPPGRAGHH
jgi:outer membrane protein TolC